MIKTWIVDLEQLGLDVGCIWCLPMSLLLLPLGLSSFNNIILRHAFVAMSSVCMFVSISTSSLPIALPFYAAMAPSLPSPFVYKQKRLIKLCECDHTSLGHSHGFATTNANKIRGYRQG
jgi:hypothetical protein